MQNTVYIDKVYIQLKTFYTLPTKYNYLRFIFIEPKIEFDVFNLYMPPLVQDGELSMHYSFIMYNDEISLFILKW